MARLNSNTPTKSVDTPIFLVGAERSGTTLLRLMLDHHPNIAFHFEFELSVEQIPQAGEWPSLPDYYAWLDTNRIFRESNFIIDRGLSYPNLVRSFLTQKQQRDGKPIVGATVHRDFDKLTRIWPDAKFIHILRDGRDVARSTLTMGWAGNVWHASQWWLNAERLWDNVRQTLPEGRWVEIKYEQLIDDPRESLTQICRFIGVPYDESTLNYSKNTTYEKPDPRLKYQWKSKMSDRQVQLVEAHIGEMLTDKGYALSGLPRMDLPPWKRQWLLWHSRWNRARFRIARYGLWLFGQDFIVRRIGTSGWRKRVQLAMNDIESQYIK